MPVNLITVLTKMPVGRMFIFFLFFFLLNLNTFILYAVLYIFCPSHTNIFSPFFNCENIPGSIIQCLFL